MTKPIMTGYNGNERVMISKHTLGRQKEQYNIDKGTEAKESMLCSKNCKFSWVSREKGVCGGIAEWSWRER